MTPLTGPFTQARGYSRGKGKVRLLAVHSAEGSRTVESLGRYFASTKAGSSNAGIDEGGYAEYVTYNNTPWTNPPVNTVTDSVELCAFARWSEAEWRAHPGMLERTAQWIAWRAAVRSIPIRLITGAQAAAGQAGVIDHRRINDGYRVSDHRDVGPNFPWDTVIGRAQELAGAKVVAVTQPEVKTSPRPGGGEDRWLGLMEPKCTGADVRGVQNALVKCGNDIALDGIYGPNTAALVSVFQSHRSIPERGVGPLTWQALRKVVHSTG